MKRPRILLIGGTGQVGSRLLECLPATLEVCAPTHQEIDLLDQQATYECVLRYRPRIVINAAAYTAVDKAEEEESRATALNATACGVLATACAAIGARLIHYSTDYVFDGMKAGCYVEEDVPAPLSAYGRSKLFGEQLIAQSGAEYTMLRCSWVYDNRGTNFAQTMLRAASEGKNLCVVDTQFGAPTPASSIAGATKDIIQSLLTNRSSRSALYHMTCRGETTWYGFARAIFELVRPEELQRGSIRLRPTIHFPSAAARPQNSRLCSDKLFREFGIRLPDWLDALRETFPARP